MRQRVVIALALCANPQLIIADEPTTALDVSIQAQIITLLKRLCREHGTAVMLVTHDMGVIAETADRVAVMYAGRIVEIGPVQRRDPRSPQHPYTVGPDGLDPDARRSDVERLRADRRRDAAPERDPAGLRLQSALPARLRPLPRRAARTCSPATAAARRVLAATTDARRRAPAGGPGDEWRGACLTAHGDRSRCVEVARPRALLRRVARRG